MTHERTVDAVGKTFTLRSESCIRMDRPQGSFRTIRSCGYSTHVTRVVSEPTTGQVKYSPKLWRYYRRAKACGLQRVCGKWKVKATPKRQGHWPNAPSVPFPSPKNSGSTISVSKSCTCVNSVRGVSLWAFPLTEKVTILHSCYPPSFRLHLYTSIPFPPNSTVSSQLALLSLNLRSISLSTVH